MYNTGVKTYKSVGSASYNLHYVLGQQCIRFYKLIIILTRDVDLVAVSSHSIVENKVFRHISNWFGV